MSDMKCPFCQQKMSKSENNMFYCGTDNCSLRYVEMPQKALEDFAESYQDRLNDCKRIGNLNEELIRTRKALDVAVDALKIIGSGKVIEHSVMFHEDDNKISIANKALEQITALEQKD